MDLRISQQYGRIGLDIQKPQVKLKTTMPRENVSYNYPKVVISSPDPKVRIDQTQCWVDMGARNPKDYGAYIASQGQSKVMEGIARRTQEGDTLASIDQGSTIVGVITSRRQQARQCESNIAFIPEHPPQVEAEVGEMELNTEEGGASVSAQLGSVENNAPWAKVDMYVLQKSMIDVQWVGSHYDTIT